MRSVAPDVQTPFVGGLAAEKVGQVAVRETEGVMVEVSVGEINTPAIISTTAAGVIISLNRAAERLLGIAAEQVIGKVTLVLFHDQAELDCRRERLAAQSGRVSSGSV